jgi:hypothetical protein
VDTLFYCGSEQQRERVRQAAGPPLATGIDYLKLSAGEPRLRMRLIHPFEQVRGAAQLTDKQILIEDQDGRALRVRSVARDRAGAEWIIATDSPDLAATYRLRIRRSPGDPAPPEGYYPPLVELAFTFGGTWPAEGGGAPGARPAVEPEISYLAKDYASFRRLMLDRMAALVPGGVEDQPADLQVALLELLAHSADRLSYYQDAVATEAYLGTARSRVSLRRHARLLDYRLHEGCNARVWICCDVDRTVQVGNDWRFLTVGATPPTFAPCHRPTLWPQHGHITLYAWGEAAYTLPAGATRATLAQPPAAQPQLVVGPDGLAPGAFLMLKVRADPGAVPLHHVVRLTAAAEGRDPLNGQKIVEVAWGAEDALPACWAGKPAATACANVVLADHGDASEATDLGVLPERVSSRLKLGAGPLTYAEALPADLAEPARAEALTSATALMRRDARAALPAIGLHGEGTDWQASSDLLASGVEAAFVVESEHDGGAYLRFGDGVYGRRPTTRSSFSAHYRVGNGRAGNVAPEAICRVTGFEAWGVRVRNPLSATGGEDPEPAEQVRLFAPQAFRRQERAITADDYAARAKDFPGVQRAAAEMRWTGSWYTVYLFVDRTAGRAVDNAFKDELRAHLERYRLAGYDLEIRGPTLVPLAIALAVELKAGFTPNAVRAALEEMFSSGELVGGRRGFFHPDRWSFGQPVYLSRLYEAALAAAGVAAVDASRFGRLDRPNPQARALGVIAIGPHEIACLDTQHPVSIEVPYGR